MDIMVLDYDFVYQYIIDTYISFIWTDRYSAYGDFELYLPMSNDILDKLKQGYYLKIDTSDHAMIIENLKLTTDVENGPCLLVTGRSLESILLRRIIWEQTVFSVNALVEEVIRKLLNDAIISPGISERAISNFEGPAYRSEEDRQQISGIKIQGTMQFTGDNLYDAIKKIYDSLGLGFRIILTDSGKFVFQSYIGSNRSYDQVTLPIVEFSPNFDNLIDSEYAIDITNYKNVTLVAGEGEGVDRVTEVVDDGYSGLSRYELYTDARDLSTNVEDGTLTPSEYKEVLRNRGISKLTETIIESNFNAKVDYLSMYVYNRDYTIGDIVQFINEYGIGAKVRITEFIQSDSTENGMEQYPTFEILEEV